MICWSRGVQPGVRRCSPAWVLRSVRRSVVWVRFPVRSLVVIIGGIVGGVGSWLNKDELTDLAARAATRQDQLKEQFDGFGEAPGWGFAVSEWGGVASKMINPTSNLWRGVNEVQTGGRDDQTVDWYAVDTTSGDRKVDGRTQAIDVAATVVDAAAAVLMPDRPWAVHGADVRGGCG